MLQIFPLDLIARSHPEQFMSDRVTVILEWALLNLQIYYQQLLRSISVNFIPQPIANSMMFTGNTRARLTLSYNTLYNVSITQDSACQQLIRTKFLLLSYGKPSIYTDNSNSMTSAC